MKIFLSWSGERSKAAAKAFYDWLPDVLQSVQPWMSSEDICSGAGWNQEIRSALNDSNFGIIFVTRDNQASVWLMFEAGALAKHVDEARVVPLIVDEALSPAMLSGPLSQLQAREATEEKLLRLVRDINYVSDVRLSEQRVDRCFSANWQRLRAQLQSLPSAVAPPPKLDTNEMLTQIIGILRSERSTAQAKVPTSSSTTKQFRNRLEHSLASLPFLTNEQATLIREYFWKLQLENEATTIISGGTFDVGDLSVFISADGEVRVIRDEDGLKAN